MMSEFSMDLDKVMREQRGKTYECPLKADGVTVELAPALGKDWSVVSGGAWSSKIIDGEPAIAVDEERQTQTLYRLLKGWRGMTPAVASAYLGVEVIGGEAVPPTQINRLTLLRESGEFRAEIMEHLLRIHKEREEERKAREGN